MLQSSPQNLLVIPKRFVGDMVLTLGLLKRLKQYRPEINIKLACPPHLLNLAEKSPFLSSTITGSAKPLQILNKASRKDFDTALVLRPSLTQVLALKAKGIKVIGFDEQRIGPFLPRFGLGVDAVVKAPRVTDNVPHMLLLNRFLETLGIHLEDGFSAKNQFDLSIATDIDDNQTVAKLMEQNGILNATNIAAIHLSAASKEKYQPDEKWLPALRLLSEAGFEIVAIGTQSDIQLHDDIAKKAGVRLINLCGQTTLRQTTLLLGHCSLLFGHDSGPVHLAAAAKTPNIVALYGPINQNQWQPWPFTGNFTSIFLEGLFCRPCVKKVCSHNQCRTEITAEMIEKKLLDHLNQYRVIS